MKLRCSIFLVRCSIFQLIEFMVFEPHSFYDHSEDRISNTEQGILKFLEDPTNTAHHPTTRHLRTQNILILLIKQILDLKIQTKPFRQPKT